MRQPPSSNATFSDVLNALAKLNNDVASLHRSVTALGSKLKVMPSQNGGEAALPFNDALNIILTLSKDRGKMDTTALRDSVVGFRLSFDAMAADIRMIRAHMDAVANNAEPSDEFKLYWKNGRG